MDANQPRNEPEPFTPAELDQMRAEVDGLLQAWHDRGLSMSATLVGLMPFAAYLAIISGMSEADFGELARITYASELPHV